MAPFSVKSAARVAADVHVICKPVSDERAGAQNYNQNASIQQKLRQAL